MFCGIYRGLHVFLVWRVWVGTSFFALQNLRYSPTHLFSSFSRGGRGKMSVCGCWRWRMLKTDINIAGVISSRTVGGSNDMNIDIVVVAGTRWRQN